MDHDPPIDTWARLAAITEAARLIILIDAGATEEEVERSLRRLTADQRAQLRAAMDEVLGEEADET